MNMQRTRRAARLVGLVSCALLVGGCSDSDAPPAHAAGTDTEPRWTYPGILGVVTMLEVESDPASGFKIRHEHIPTFVNPRSGELATTNEGVPGMRSMNMEMPPAGGVDISGFAVGDKVRFTLGVWDTPRIDWKLTRIEKLDANTPVSFDDKPAP